MPKKPHAAAPVIETERLLLRSYRREDFADFHSLWNTPEVYRYISHKPQSDEDNWARLMRLLGHWPLCGFGSWAVTLKTSGELIGQCGFGDHRRDMGVAMPEPEMGWVLAPQYHQQGIGLEFCTAAAAWGDENLGVAKTSCLTSPENAASNRLASKLGFTKTIGTTYKNETVLIHHRERFAI